MKRSIVITGLGAITALGEGADALWRAAREARSAIRGLPDGFKGASLEAFEPEKFVTQRKSLKIMARDIQLAVAAASLALEDAGAKAWAGPRDRFGVIVGSGVLNHELDELLASFQASAAPEGGVDLKRFGTDGLSALFPLWLLKYLPNMPACHISIAFNLQGVNNTITSGAAAGLQAVGEAARIIERGAADLMLAGGAESKVNPVGFSHYDVLGVLSRGAYRPFDERADGIVPGEGAGFVLLEEKEHAIRRGARIYAGVTGFGSSNSSGHAIAMRAALDDAGLGADGVDYLQASGIGIPEEDRLEAGAIEEVFDGSATRLAVSASKAVTGFTGFSAGPLDLILAARAITEQTVTPAAGLEREQKNWRLAFVKGAPRPMRVRRAMVNASGLGAQCASVVIEKS
ncbi:MAG: hypothetical protein A3D28_01190 [Omnitrophica bacterium RIFCSPHIGHO2_02_FULL_63_14]|nr:MAG: hypothetical protein A3D28_01190 [Omnitrophica bacterium RIFCSPHIGHO2_02_FULL_63_14]